jgi:aminoglycoside phosphotransferase (APT) family kinase protein
MTVEVRDPFGAARDPELPVVAHAIDAHEAQRELGGRRLPRLVGTTGTASVSAIRVVRHKPGRRCVIEYDLEVERAGRPNERVTLIGKIRHARYGLSGFRLLAAFWNAGFDAASADGISVPEPIGSVGKFTMWLQRKVPGILATTALAGPDGTRLARRIADAAHKVHRAGVPTPARHTADDELRILRDCLERVTRTEPIPARRVESILAACERLAAALRATAPLGIHRDFYADQVIVDGERLYLLDFDLYCAGDPALDIGNFIGHVTEHSLRALGRANALQDRERALTDRFAELAGDEIRDAVAAYTTLTLVRHVYLSTIFPERRPFTAALLDLCEARLATVPALVLGGARCG